MCRKYRKTQPHNYAETAQQRIGKLEITLYQHVGITSVVPVVDQNLLCKNMPLSSSGPTKYL